MVTAAQPSKIRTADRAELPRVSPWLIRLFLWYLRRYIPKHFHAFAINNTEALACVDAHAPLIVFLNHASWWDPLIALTLNDQFFTGRRLYAPIDAVAVEKYPMMQRLGFFPVEQDSIHGAGNFLKAARGILTHPQTSIWMTPEGQFADPRHRTLLFQPGLAHLASKLETGFLVPLAVEYTFWEERLPEVLCRFGEPIAIEAYASQDKEAWSRMLESSLRQQQVELEKLAIARNSDAFRIVLSGGAGVSLAYDLLRRGKSLIMGQPAKSSHGGKLQ